MVAVTINKAKTNRIVTTKTPVLELIYEGEVGQDHTFRPGLSFTESVEHFWGINDGIWNRREISIPVVVGNNISVYCPKKAIDKAWRISIGYKRITLDFNIFPDNFSPTNIQANNLTRIRNINVVSNSNYNNLKELRINSSRAGGNVADLNLEDKLDLEKLVIYASGFTGIFDIGKLIKLKEFRINNCGFLQVHLDYFARRLYEEGNLFTGTGKIWALQMQANGQVLSGTIGDPVTSGTGQGYITGLINDFGWTITQ